MRFKYVIVGAGLAGITMAERIATQLNEDVLIIEKRNHIAGNVYDKYDSAGILIHAYGPHTFHTSDEEVFKYICNFTRWHDYQHRVLSYVDGMFVPLPISLDTINKLYNLNLSQEDLEVFFASRREDVDRIASGEDVVVSQIGRDLYNKFYLNYTKKQWGVFPSELDSSVLARIPIRKNRDSRYFNDKYQGSPQGGFTQMCQNMLNHPKIKLLLNTDYKEVINDIDYDVLIYTGAIDYFFDYKFGKLKYRSLRLEFETYDMESYQDVASTRWPNDYDFTRITEFKKMTGQVNSKTTILKEYPCDEGEPYYPFPSEEWEIMAQKYRELALLQENTYFVGRLAEYKYYDMDDVIRSALDLFEEIAKK